LIQLLTVNTSRAAQAEFGDGDGYVENENEVR
jgi:hypothetical protein